MSMLQYTPIPVEDAVYASLRIEPRAVNLSAQQLKSDEYVQYFDEREDPPINRVNVKDYSICNLPNVFARIPKNSIFAQINAIPYNMPDIRYIYVDPNVNQYKPTVLHAATNDPITLSSSTNDYFDINQRPQAPESMFLDSIPTQIIMNEHIRPEGNTTDDTRFSLLGNKPQNIQRGTMVNVISPAYDGLVRLVKEDAARQQQINATDTTAEALSGDSSTLVPSIVKYLPGISRETCIGVLNGTNEHMNIDTVKLGMILAFVSSLNGNERRAISDSTKREIAITIDRRVNEYS